MDINQDSYIGYGTTTPQTIIHLVQSNVTLRLEDPRNDNGGSVNIEFKNGSTGNSDWKLSSSNSSFHITSTSDNNTCNILSINSEGNIVISNDIVIGGNFVKSGEVFDITKIGSIDSESYSYVSNYVNVSSNNLFNNMYSNFYTKDQINSCNYIKSELLPTNIVTQTILNSCNYVKDISFIKSYWKNIDATSKNSIYYGAPIKIGGNKSIDIADNYILDIIGNVRVNGVITQGWTGDGSKSGDGGGLTANIFGSGSEITNLNANNIASGILQVQYGGTGTNTIETDRILIGGTNSITSSSKLTWDNATNTLSVFDIRGIGSNITRIHASNISTGTINSSRLPIATNNNIGAIKRGSNISIDNNGSLSVNLDYYTGDAIINGDLIVNSNLILNGQTIQLNTSEYSTEKLDIINTGGGTSLSISQSSPTNNNNIINISNYTNTDIFNITKDGHINFTEQINGIDKIQFSKIANIDSNNENCSNYVETASNSLFADYTERFAEVSSIIDSNNNNCSNYVETASNSLFADYTARFTEISSIIDSNNANCSNYVETASNSLFTDYTARFIEVSSIIDSNNTNCSNYVEIASNSLFTDYIARNIEMNDRLISEISTYVGYASNYVDVNKLTEGNNINIINNEISANLGLYNGNAVINGTLTVHSDLIVNGIITSVNVTETNAQKFDIVNGDIGPTLRIKQTTQINNIVNVSNYLDSEVFNITTEGYINFSERINDINKTQFSKIANIDTNDSNCSNFVRASSDILFLDYTARIDDLKLYTEANDVYTSNFIRDSSNILFSDYVERDNFTSNFIRDSSNILFSDYVERDNFTSNFIRDSSNILFSDYVERDNFTSNFIRDSSNILFSDYVERDNFTSNFIRDSSNILFSDYVERDNFTSNFIRDSSNILFSDYVERITLVALNSTSAWTISDTNIYNNNVANVGIGTTEPSAYKLQVVGSIGASGDITASYSDERLKNITEYINDVLPILSKINVFRYNCNDIGEKYGYDKSKKELGLSAQEIQKYYPELVSLAPFDTDYDPEKQKIISKSGKEYLTLNYERLVPVLLQGIKELKQEINELKVRLSKLE